MYTERIVLKIFCLINSQRMQEGKNNRNTVYNCVQKITVVTNQPTFYDVKTKDGLEKQNNTHVLIKTPKSRNVNEMESVYYARDSDSNNIRQCINVTYKGLNGELISMVLFLVI